MRYVRDAPPAHLSCATLLLLLLLLLCCVLSRLGLTLMTVAPPRSGVTMWFEGKVADEYVVRGNSFAVSTFLYLH